MLNDKRRNEVYLNSIRDAILIKPGATVLDIGGGTGILSIYAAQSGASKVSRKIKCLQFCIYLMMHSMHLV